MSLLEDYALHCAFLILRRGRLKFSRLISVRKKPKHFATRSQSVLIYMERTDTFFRPPTILNCFRNNDEKQCKVNII